MEEVWGAIAVLGLILYLILGTGRRNRKREFAVLGSFGLIALIVGVVLLFNLGSWINFEAIEGIEDLLSVGRIIITVVLVAIVGIFVVRGGIRGAIKQSKFEHEVDKFHDAWDSRNDRM